MMAPVLKFVLFCLFIWAMTIGFYRLYRLLNRRILDSRTLGGVIGFALLLVAVNVVLFAAGLFAFFKLYEFLTLVR